METDVSEVHISLKPNKSFKMSRIQSQISRHANRQEKRQSMGNRFKTATVQLRYGQIGPARSSNEDVEMKVPLCTVGGDADCYKQCRKKKYGDGSEN